MDERPGWETNPSEPTGGEPSTTEGPTLRYDSPTLPGLPWQSAPSQNGADFNTQPLESRTGRSAARPEWPVARPGGRSTSSSTQGAGNCFGITIVGMLGVALVLALIAGTLVAVHTFGSSPPTGENRVIASASQSPKVSTATAHPAQPSPTALQTTTPTAMSSPTPIPAQLSVSPLQETGTCLVGRYDDLTLQNTGGSDLTWSATTRAASVNINPSSGTLAAGATQTITLHGGHIGKSFTVTFGGNGGNATVTITCA
jgi:hypothetical protein